MGASCGKTNPKTSKTKSCEPSTGYEKNVGIDPLLNTNDSDQQLMTTKQLRPILNEIDKICTNFHKLYLLLDMIFDLIHLCMRAKNEKDDSKELITKTMQNMQDFDKIDLNVIVDALSKVQHTIVTQTNPIIISKLCTILSKLPGLTDVFIFKNFISYVLDTLELNDGELLSNPKFIDNCNLAHSAIKAMDRLNKDIIQIIREN